MENNNDKNKNENNDNDNEIEDENFYDDMPPLISIEEINKLNINKMNKMNININNNNNNNNSNEDDNYDTTFEPPSKRRCMSAPQLTSYNNDNDNKNLSYEDLILSTNTNMFDSIDSIDYNLYREHCISILVKECRTSYESNKECPVKNCICKMFIDNYTKN